jgi:hypothetical protein
MSRSAERWTWLPEQFLLGANLPWIDYGCDFGASAWFPDGGLGARPDALARFDAVMDRLAADRVSIVRLFLLCDLRSGIRFDAEGNPLGPDDAFFRDADAVFDTAAVRGMRLLPVLFDFHLCDAAQVVNGVQVGGRGALLADPVKRERLLSTVVQPVAERYGEHPGIAAWDLFNEPEWCTRLFPPAWGTGVMTFARMRECLGQMADCLHACARQPVTVGSASAEYLDLVRGLGLDFYQVHWYEPFGWAALAEPVDRFDLDRPVLLGEFPGRGASATPADIVSTARRAGYAGALIWSVVSQDSASGYTEGLAIGEPT